MKKKYSHKCEPNEDEICDFCLHFLFYRDKEGMNLDGSGWCGLKRKQVDAADGCKDYYCKMQWQKNMKEIGESLLRLEKGLKKIKKIKEWRK